MGHMKSEIDMKLSFCFACIICASLLLVGASSVNAQTPSGKHNVLLISIDDLNNMLGCYGHGQVKSPNIDRIAARGIKFDRAYSQYPLCNPSRASFLSGLRPETTGIFDLQTSPRHKLPNAVFLPQLFRGHGYFTARVGKIFHDGRDDAASWDVSDEGKSQDTQELAAARRRYERTSDQRSPEWTALDGPDESTGDGIVAGRVAELMERSVKEGKPFFLAAGFRKPHLPWTAPRKYFDLYPPDKIVLPSEPAMREIPELALMTELTGSPPPRSRSEAVAAYQACVSFMDAQAGVLLRTMDRLRLWENTVIVVFSDHGFHLGDHGGLWAKLTLFEQSARVPLVIAAPNLSGDKASGRTVELLDIYPTLAELCGLPRPEALEGRSLVPLLKQPRAAWEKPAYTMVHHKNILGKSVRTERWRYTEWGEGKEGVELYDHTSDPHEFSNFASNPRYAGVVTKMKRLLRLNGKSTVPAKR